MPSAAQAAAKASRFSASTADRGCTRFARGKSACAQRHPAPPARHAPLGKAAVSTAVDCDEIARRRGQGRQRQCSEMRLRDRSRGWPTAELRQLSSACSAARRTRLQHVIPKCVLAVTCLAKGRNRSGAAMHSPTRANAHRMPYGKGRMRIRSRS